MNLPENFEQIVGDAAYTAMIRGSSVKNPNPMTRLEELGLDSVNTAGVCAKLQGLLSQAGLDITSDIVDNAVQSAFADPNTTVGSAVSAVRQNMLSEISRVENRKTRQTAA